MAKKQSKLSSFLWGAAAVTAGATKAVATEAAKEVLVGPKKSPRKSAKKTASDGLWSILTG